MIADGLMASGVLSSLLRFDVFELDTRSGQLWRSGIPVDLPPQALRILMLLAGRPNLLVTRKEIKQALWPDETYGDFDSRLNFAIRKLREALNDSAEQPRYVRTVRSAGYMFIAPVREQALKDLEVAPIVASGTGSGAARAFPKIVWLMAITVICGLAVGGYLLWSRLYGGLLASAEFTGKALVARNQRGAVLWRHVFETPFRENPEALRLRVTIADLGPDRERDLLVEVPLALGDQSVVNDALYDFSAQGKVRWRYEFDGRPRFGGHEYAPPWQAASLMITWQGTVPSIWAVARETFWSASTLVKFDRDGQRLAQYINWGHIAVLRELHGASGSYILAGGISNQCNCAMLAVLKEDSPSGSSPPLEPDYRCENCPEGRPYRYLLFPKSELTLLAGHSYNNIRLIHVDDGHVWVGTSETDLDTSPPGTDWIKYELSDNFVPQSFTVSDHFWTSHRQMEVEGKIHHSVEECPERNGPIKAQMWSPERGWEWITVPVSTER